MRHMIAFLLATFLLFYPALPMARADEPPVTRAAFVESLWRQLGALPFEDTFAFSDVPSEQSYTNAICWAYYEGLVKGVGGCLFAPDRPITREEAATLLRRAAGYLGRSTATTSNVAECNDYADISPWADDSLYWATESGLIGWAEGGLRAPLGTLTPTETADIFQRFE